MNIHILPFPTRSSEVNIRYNITIGELNGEFEGITEFKQFINHMLTFCWCMVFLSGIKV